MKRRQSGQVLIVLFSSLLIGGSGLAAGLLLTGKTTSEMRKQALTIVEDPSRTDEIKAVLKQWEREVKGIEKTRNKHIDELISALRRHDAAPADFAPIFAAFDDLELRAFDAALDMRFALREQLSPEEWRRMFPNATSASALDQRRTTLQSQTAHGSEHFPFPDWPPNARSTSLPGS